MFDDAKHEDVDQLFEEEDGNLENEEPASEQSSTEDDFLSDEKQDSTKSSREEVKEKQVQVWLGRIASGEKSLEDIPQDKKWLKNLVAERLNKPAIAQDDIEKLVEKKLAEREAEKSRMEADRKFLQLKSEINQLDLDADEKAIIETKYKNLVNKGLDKVSALEEAKSYFDLVKGQSEAQLQELRKRMGIPKVRSSQKVKEKLDLIDEEFHKFGASKDRVAYYEQLRRASKKA